VRGQARVENMVENVTPGDYLDVPVKNRTAGRRMLRIFAFFAVVIMISTCFEMFVMPGKAESSTVEVTPVDESVPLTDDMALSTSKIKNPPASIESPPGTVESYRSSSNPYITLGDVGNSIGMSTLTASNDTLLYQTYFGVYVVDRSNPTSICVKSSTGKILTQESCFIIANSSMSTIPTKGEITSYSNDSLSFIYDLIADEKNPAAIARMEVDIDFSMGRMPKITATVLSDGNISADWQIVWLIALPEGSPTVYAKNQSIALCESSLLGNKMAIPDLNVEIVVPSEKDFANLTVDWRDAGSGTLGMYKSSSSHDKLISYLQVEFEKGRTVIDPSLVSTTVTRTPIVMTTQREIFYYGGYYWAFYYTGSAICYRNSTDGVTWNAQVLMPESTAFYSATSGFDVAMRNGLVVVAWHAATDLGNFYSKSGTILGNKIIWSSRLTISSAAVDESPCVAIADDMCIWWAFFTNIAGVKRINIWRSSPSDPSYRSEQLYADTFQSAMAVDNLWAMILPTSGGSVALLDTSYLSGGSYNGYVRIRYYIAGIGGSGGWTTPISINLYMRNQYKYYALSAVAEPDGEIHIASMYQNNNSIAYTLVKTDGTPHGKRIMDASAGDAVISLDTNGFLHIFDIYGYSYGGHLYYSIRHMSKTSSSVYSAWPSSSETLYTAAADIAIDGLTSWANPVYCHNLLWAEHTATESVKFASLPLPFGTPGASSEPWNRDGISPYGTYFSMIGDSVSPGSGQLFVTQTDVSIPGRGGLDLGIGRIYQQPKYFYNLNSTPYGAGKFPFSNLGKYWSLDLPWIDEYYVSLPGGQRFVIQWGNNGQTSEFENHDGAHFLMRSVTKGSISYIELILSSGLRYNFSSSAPYLLKSITDMKGYDPYASTFSLPYNCINISYDGSNRITSMTDRGLARSITFTYNASSLLTQITRPDGKQINFTYIKYGSNYYLRTASDPVGRITLFIYNSTASYCLDSMTYPTKGRTSYSYSQNSNSSTETYSWLVTKETLKDNVSGSIYRQTIFDYKVVNGKIIFTKQTDKNDTAAVQGYTEYVFQSVMGYSSTVKKNSTGVQMSQTRTWYDFAGQPCRVDQFKGASTEVNYSTYTNYDNWGNVIFSRDALGHEIYSSYLNTSTQNSFQGGDILTRTSSGKILYDSFDDWDFSDWTKAVPAGHAEIYGAGGDADNAPAVHVHKTTSGTCWVYRGIGSQAGPIVYIQFTFNTSTNAQSNFFALSGGSSGNIRICIDAYAGNFRYYSGSAYIAVAPCKLNTKYEVGLYAIYGSNTYSIAIDGVFKTTAAPLLLSGSLDTIGFQAGGIAPAQIWFDNVRVYKSQVITINGFPSGYLAELFDSKGNILVRSKTGTLAVSDSQLSKFPPAFMKISPLGYYSFNTPIGDIWGGDTYSFSTGLSISSTPKTYKGYSGASSQKIADDGTPSGATWDNGYFSMYGNPSNSDCTWVNDAGSSVSGSYYHESTLRVPDAANNYNASHYHGFKNADASSRLMVYPDRMISQYIWLDNGMVPYEIAITFHDVNDGRWKRAYWAPQLGTYVWTPGGYYYYTRIGDVPQTTGKWIELTMKPRDLGFTSQTTVDAIYYGLYGGKAKWDCTSVCNVDSQLRVNGLTAGQTVKLKLDNGVSISGTASTTYVDLDLYQAGVRVFPVSGVFTISQGSTTLYTSQRIEEIWLRDEFTYSQPSFYSSQIKGFIHSKVAGMYQYQNVAKTVSQESYVKYDLEGNSIESKSKSGSGWIFTQATFDAYGNMLWNSDPTGRGAISEFSNSNKYTYPISTASSGLTDNFDYDTSWTSYKTSANGQTGWLTSQYTAARAYSSPNSIQLSFLVDGTTSSYGWASMSKEYKANPVASISVRMYVETYTKGFYPTDKLAVGIKMHLFNSAGEYALYTYWLDQWEGGGSGRTLEPNTTMVFGPVPMSTWMSAVMHPSEDWDINWTGIEKVKFDLFLEILNPESGVAFKGYFDDFTYDDSTANSKTTYSYNIKTGSLLSTTDPLGHQVSSQYDRVGRIIRMNNSDGSYATITYDDTNQKTTSLDELNHKIVQYFDRIGRLVKTERYNTSTLYSSMICTYNWQDQIASFQNALGFVTRNYYDYFGRTTKVLNPDGTSCTISYNDQANLVTSIDENGHKTVQVFDDLGRLNVTREYCSSSSYYETKMACDAVGNLLTVRVSNGNVTRFFYDSQNKVTQVTYPDSLMESMVYDKAGRVLNKTNRNGQTSYSDYDSSGKLLRLTTLNDTMSFLYDADGKMIKLKNNLATNYYFYNSRDLMTSMSEKIISNHTVSFDYTKEGSLWNITYPNSIKVTYTYDPYDRVIKIDRNTSTRLLTVYYNTDDTISRESTGSTQVTNYTYNSRGWVSQIQAKNGSKFVLSTNYTYDAVGNIRNISYTSTSYENYTYDWLDRLVRAKGAGANGWGSTITYGYDSMGNRLWKNENSINTTYTYGAYNKLTKNTTTGSDTTWSYNKNGALRWKNTTSSKYQYAINSMDRLTDVYKWTYSGSWSRSLVASYSYDANGARAKTIEGSKTTEYVYSGHDPYCDKLNGTYTDYVYLNGRLKVKMVGSDNYWYIDDALGSTRLVYKGTVKVYSVTTYKPFGIAYGASGTEKFTYAGEMLDSPSGLFYLCARYYDPGTGRFISMDPKLGKLSMPQTLNRYTYCANNPINRADPTGEFWNIIIGAVAGAIIGGVVAAVTGGDVLAGAASGAVAGAIVGATFGLAAAAGLGAVGTTVAMAIGGAVAGAASYTTEYAVQKAEGKDVKWDWGEFAFSVGVGGALSAGGYGAGRYLGKVFAKTGITCKITDWWKGTDLSKVVNKIDKIFGKAPVPQSEKWGPAFREPPTMSSFVGESLSAMRDEIATWLAEEWKGG
jgi:RHS repeat-associated protein